MPDDVQSTIFGQTPLPEDFRKDLIPKHILLLKELNELEAENISRAVQKYLFGKRKKWNLTTPSTILKIHKDMFSDVWTWAGRFRHIDLNLGRPKAMVAQEVKQLCDDLKYWIDRKTYETTEIAVRFHYRLVTIHPFVNGNGRLSRICANVIIQQCGEIPLTWGGADLNHEGTARKKYIEALKEADRGDLKKLILFARS